MDHDEGRVVGRRNTSLEIRASRTRLAIQPGDVDASGRGLAHAAAVQRAGGARHGAHAEHDLRAGGIVAAPAGDPVGDAGLVPAVAGGRDHPGGGVARHGAAADGVGEGPEPLADSGGHAGVGAGHSGLVARAQRLVHVPDLHAEPDHPRGGAVVASSCAAFSGEVADASASTSTVRAILRRTLRHVLASASLPLPNMGLIKRVERDDSNRSDRAAPPGGRNDTSNYLLRRDDLDGCAGADSGQGKTGVGGEEADGGAGVSAAEQSEDRRIALV